RIVGVELVLDARLLERLLDAQHLLDLVADRELVLEDQRHVVSQVDGTELLVREHPRAELRARFGVRLERHQAVAGNLRHGGYSSRSIESVGDAHEREWMRLAHAGIRVLRIDPLQDSPSGDWAIGAHVVGLAVAHALEHGLADPHRRRVELALDAPGAVVTRAALDGVDGRLRYPLEHLARFLSDVLHACMARDVITDAAKRSLEVASQQPVLL